MSNAKFLLDNFSDKATIYSYTLDNIIDVSNTDNGLTLGTGYVNTTTFTFFNIIRGSEYLPERCQINTTPDIANNLDGTYFTTYTPITDYYIWYSTNDSTTNPLLPGFLGIKVNINTNDTAIDIAIKTKLRLYSIVDFLVQDGFTTDKPVDNIQDSFRDSYAKTESNTDIEIVGQFDKVRPVSSFVLGRHKLPINTRYRIRLYSDATGEDKYIQYDTGYLLVTTDLTILEEEFDPDVTLVEWFPEIVEQVIYFKLNFYLGSVPQYFTNSNIDDSTVNLSYVYVNNENASGDTAVSLAEYYEFGRLFIGKYTEVTYNLSYGHNLSWEEKTKQYRPGSGTLRSDGIAPYRKMEFSLKTVSENDRPDLQHGFRTVGLRRDFYMSLFSNDISIDKQEDYNGIMKLIKIPKFTEFNYNYYTSKYIMEEV